MLKQLYGFILIFWLAINQVLEVTIDLMSIASLLGILCLFIIKERFLDKVFFSIILLAFILVLSQYNQTLILLAGIPLLDFLYSKKYLPGILTFITVSVISVQTVDFSYLLHFIFAALLGFALGEKIDNEKRYTSLLDEERNLRYRLEGTQKQLIKSRKEIEHLTEIRERNRIAHEIHDSLGHSIAGVIFQIEAARRVIDKDKDKLSDILRLCSGKLSEALELTRNTVYNIKADKNIGLESLEKILNNFYFCSIVFEHSGDFNTVSTSNISILESVLMESLTNAAKHSNAKNIHIKIEIGKKHIRYYYKDNGIGCVNIQENLGISGMRDRVKNTGGTIAIDGKDGFLIVCHLPVKSEDYQEGEYV